jgi:EpsI family protein
LKQNAQDWLRFLVAALLLAGTALYLQARDRIERVPQHQPLADFPMQIDDWSAKRFEIAPEIREILGKGDFESRIYQQNPRAPYIDLFLAFFPTQRTGDTVHSPQHCLPGAGWTPIEAGRMQIALADGRTVTVNRYIIGKGEARQFVLYWYQAHGRVIASEYWAKIYLVADAIRMNRSDGALARVITPIAPSEGAEVASERAVGFAKEVLRRLDTFVPR